MGAPVGVRRPNRSRLPREGRRHDACKRPVASEVDMDPERLLIGSQILLMPPAECLLDDPVLDAAVRIDPLFRSSPACLVRRAPVKLSASQAASRRGSTELCS